jgi:hypothetical protein
MIVVFYWMSLVSALYSLISFVYSLINGKVTYFVSASMMRYTPCSGKAFLLGPSGISFLLGP